MFNGKCKIWREGDELHAVMNLSTPSGPIEWKDKIPADLDDPTAHSKIVRKAKYVAGFFPTREMVGSDAYEAAERLYGEAMKPETRDQVLQAIESFRNASLEGDGAAHDVMYALDRVVGSHAEVIGGRLLKRIGKKFKKAAAKITKNPVVNVAFPPVAAYNLVKNARKNPLLRKKIATIAKIAVFPPAAIAMALRDRKGNPAPASKVEEMQAQAQEAIQYIDQAQEMQDVAYEETGDYDAFAPASYSEDYAEYPMNADEYADSESEEFVGLALYRDGAEIEETTEEEISGLFSVAKAIGRKIDPSKKGSPFRAGLAALPGVGPAIKTSLDLLDAAKQGQKDAAAKIKTIKELASAGVPKAKEAEANLKTAQNLQNKMQSEVAKEINPGKKTWFPGFGIYASGARS